MVKSMNVKDESASKDKMLKMDTVKEESIDDSAQSVSNKQDVTQSLSSTSKVTPGSKKQEGFESSMGSLPSEDISVKDSVRSVEWKFDVKQPDSAREDATTPKDGKQLSDSSDPTTKKGSENVKEEAPVDESIIEEDSSIHEESDSQKSE